MENDNDQAGKGPGANYVGMGGIIILIIYVTAVIVAVFWGIYRYLPQCASIPALNTALLTNSNNTNPASNNNTNSISGNGNQTSNVNANTNNNTRINANTAAVNAGSNSNTRTNTATPPTNSNTAANSTVRITSISPSSGPASGNTSVLITGSGFTKDTTVLFDGITAAKDTSLEVSNESILVKSPVRERTGQADIAVVNPNGSSSVLSQAFTYRCSQVSEINLFLIVIFAGALGGGLHALRSLFWYIGNRHLVWSWTPMYFLLPFSGASIAAVFYLVLYGGFIPNTPQSGETYWFIIGIGVLVGMFSQQAALKLQDIANITLTKPGSGSESKPQTSDSQSTVKVETNPEITIEPDKGKLIGGEKIKITGKGFEKIREVKFNGGPVQFTPIANSPDVEFTVPGAAAAGEVEISVSVDNKPEPIILKYTYEDVGS